ncbi:MAG: leucyl/phenylalanyl-tRNA--protein transferase [Trueperaceae bacterium]|nr:leucyl/phenylalanyl-tRNA--protein transferase [Trueperaceae bacterium]
MDLTPELLLQAYARGYFPMADSDDEVYWYDPDPRTIIPLESFHVSRSLRKTLRQEVFEVSFDRCFREVMEGCAEPAPGRESTWISDEFVDLYTALHRYGYAHSAETWLSGRLVGGVYGVSIGGFFAGESMFSRVSDSSKVALVSLLAHLRARGYTLFDTQFSTAHLRRFGALDLSRAAYKRRLAAAIRLPVTFQ